MNTSKMQAKMDSKNMKTYKKALRQKTIFRSRIENLLKP